MQVVDISKAIGVDVSTSLAINENDSGIPYASDLLARFTTRAAGSLNIGNTISVNNAVIKGGKAGKTTGTEYFTTTKTLTGGQPFSFEWHGIFENTANAGLMSTSASTTTGKGIVIYFVPKMRLYIIDGTSSEYFEPNFTFVNGTFYDLDITWNGQIGGTVTIKINASTFTYTATKAWTGESGVLRMFSLYNNSATLLFKGTHYYTSINNQRIFHFNGHVIDSVTGSAATNAGVTFINVRSYNPQGTQLALDNGYFLLSTGEKVINPGYTKPAGATAFTNSGIHNFIDTYVDFAAIANILFDRSNTDVYEDSGRASIHYNSSFPYQRHITELLNDTINDQLKPAYKNRFYIAIYQDYTTKNYVVEIFAYNTQKTESQHLKIKKYCGDI